MPTPDFDLKQTAQFLGWDDETRQRFTEQLFVQKGESFNWRDKPTATALQELRDEIAALREDLRPHRSIIATGEDVMEEYRRLQGGRHE